MGVLSWGGGIMCFDILLNSAILSFSLITHHLISPFTCFLCVCLSSLLGASVYLLTPGNQESPTAGPNSESSFVLDSLQLYCRHSLFLYPIPLHLYP